MVAGLAMPVSAEPEPPGGCAEWTQGGVIVSVSQRHNCSYLVIVDTTPCAPPSTSSSERNIGKHTVRLITCRGPDTPPISSGCAPRTYEMSGAFGVNRVTVESNCHVTITLNEGIICLGGAVGKREHNVGPITVVEYYCRDPNGGGGSLSAAPANPCGIFLDMGVLGQAEIKPDCSVEAHFVDTYRICKWNLDGFEDDRAGAYVANNEVSAGYCYPELDFTTASSDMADPFPTCIQQCGPSLPDPTRACKPASHAFGMSSIVIASDCHVTINHKTYDCVWNGHWHTEEYGLVTYRYYHCDVHNETEAQDPFVQCIRECGPYPPQCPNPNEGALTPIVDVQGHGWGTCRYDVYVANPLVACTDPIDGSIEVTVGNVRVIGPDCAPALRADPDVKNLCKPNTYGPATVEASCHVTVTLDYMSCIWGGHWTRKTVGPVTVEVYTCDGNPPNQTSAAARPCPSKYVDYANARLETRDCDLYVKLSDCITGGSYVKKASAGNSDIYLYQCFAADPTSSSYAAKPCSVVPGTFVEDDCSMISIKLYDCLWGGYWHYYATYPITVREYRCGDPPQ